MKEKTYIAIDLKSFYASVECVERGLDPLTTNLVVADKSRTEKTICLAVSPSLKAYGIPGRARLFEVVQRVKEVNRERERKVQEGFTGTSYDAKQLALHPDLKLDYIAAVPRMAHYLKCSADIYNVYLKYIAPEDIHVYSIDEVFMDVTDYLDTYKMTAKQLASKMIMDVYKTTGITATAGIGTNLYLCKVAMDILAKHAEPDENGVRIAVLNEISYREKLWNHKPLTDFWRVGAGYQKRLNENGLFTMGDVCRCSLGKETDYYNEDFLYKLFGINAELLIDHAWGYEPVTMADIKAYKPRTKSISSGQVLQCAYAADKARVVVQEMADFMALDLVEKGLLTDQLVLTVGYDTESIPGTGKMIGEKSGSGQASFPGEISTDRYGRKVPKSAHGTTNLKIPTSSYSMIIEAVLKLYDEIVNPGYLVRRITMEACRLQKEKEVAEKENYEQLSLFSLEEEKPDREKLEKERRIQEAMLSVKNRFGKNAILKGTNFREGATGKERNSQIGGHKA